MGSERLQSTSTNQLAVPLFNLSITVGKRTFPVFGATFWNSLPPDVTSAPSLSIFRQRLKALSTLSPKTATVAENGDYSRQCGQALGHFSSICHPDLVI